MSGKRPNYYCLLITDWLIEFWGEAQEWKGAESASFAPRPLASYHVTIFRCAYKSLTSCSIKRACCIYVCNNVYYYTGLWFMGSGAGMRGVGIRYDMHL